VRETPQEIAELQRMFDAHLARANPQMTAIVTPKRRLTAQQVVRHLDGKRFVAFATVTPKGQPRVSPLDTLFLHGRFTLSTDVTATRIAHLRANAACSALYLEADRIAVVANGGSPASTSTTTRSTPRGRPITARTPTAGATSSSSGSPRSRCGPTPSTPRSSPRMSRQRN